jgi:hypothetical protein
MDRMPDASGDQGNSMTISSKFVRLAAGTFIAGVITWAYAGVCLAYAVDCF